jgi:hypothetical protein
MKLGNLARHTLPATLVVGGLVAVGTVASAATDPAAGDQCDPTLQEVGLPIVNDVDMGALSTRLQCTPPNQPSTDSDVGAEGATATDVDNPAPDAAEPAPAEVSDPGAADAPADAAPAHGAQPEAEHAGAQAEEAAPPEAVQDAAPAATQPSDTEAMSSPLAKVLGSVGAGAQASGSTQTTSTSAGATTSVQDRSTLSTARNNLLRLLANPFSGLR